MKKLSLFCLLLVSFWTYAQKDIRPDSVAIKKLIDKAEKLSVANSSESIAICQQALELSKQKHYEKLDNYAYNVLGRIYSANGKIDQSKQYFNLAIALSKKYSDKAMLCSTYCDLGSLLVFESKHIEAIHYFTKSLQIADAIHLNELAFYNLYYISDLYIEEKNLEKAFEYSFKALQKLQHQNADYDYHRGAIFDQIGKAYNLKKDYARAKFNLEKSLFYYEKIKDDFGIANSTYDLYKNEYDSKSKVTIDFLISKIIKANALFNSTAPDSRNNINCLNFLAELYLQKKEYSKALAITKQSEVLCKQTNFVTALIECNRLYSQIYSKMGDFSRAYTHQLQFTSLNDSLFSQERKNELAKLESQKDILIKDKQLAIKSLELTASKKQRWYLIAGLLLLAIIGTLLWYQNQNRKKNNIVLQNLNLELDATNKAKTRFFSILNHDLRSPVSNLIDFLHLQKDSPDLLDAATKDRIEKTTLQAVENLLHSMEDILQWSKSQMENFKPQPAWIAVSSILEDVKMHFSSEEKVQLIFENISNVKVFTDENYLKTIVRNLTGNAIKAIQDTRNPTIVWKAWQENSNIYLSITDNGPGASVEQFKALYDDKEVVGIKTGLGLHLIRDLAKAIACEITVHSEPKQGTTIVLKL